MDLGSAVRVLLRRWIVLVIGMVLTVGLTAYLFTQSPPRYQATANLILLLPPNARGAEGAGSSYLYLPTGLQTLAGIVVSGTESREHRQQLLSEGLTSQFELGVEVGTPIITVSVEGLDPENVMATRDRVIQDLEDELATVQREENTPTRQTAHARIYGIEPSPDQLEGNRTRGLLMALGAGGLLTLLAAFAVDRAAALRGDWLRRRASAPRRASTADDVEDVDESAGGWGWDDDDGGAEGIEARSDAAGSEETADTADDHEAHDSPADGESQSDSQEVSPPDGESQSDSQEVSPPPCDRVVLDRSADGLHPAADVDVHVTSQGSDEQAPQYQRV